jgi:lipopolysaccharide/colanic/teichoic acid biosynthesis glycosyltransferase
MYKYLKRFFDVVCSLLAILVLLPFMLPIIILLLLTGEHYIFYRQQRVGYKNKIFYIWKFATMLKNSPNMGTGEITLRKDPRLLPMGNFLRMSKINELPQLINILTGDMSVVGPRPLMPVSFKRYTSRVQEVIYNSKPGLTGIASLIFRDEEALVSNSSLPPAEFYDTYIFPYKGELELWYLKNMSFLNDVKIIFLTAWSIVSPKNDLAKKFFPTLPKRPF